MICFRILSYGAMKRFLCAATLTKTRWTRFWASRVSKTLRRLCFHNKKHSIWTNWPLHSLSSNLHGIWDLDQDMPSYRVLLASTSVKQGWSLNVALPEFWESPRRCPETFVSLPQVVTPFQCNTEALWRTLFFKASDQKFLDQYREN